MRLSIFEEYPTKENLQKLDLLSQPVYLYIAAPSLEQWKVHREGVINHPSVTGVGYWPILTEREGYWLSPFAQLTAIERVTNELCACGEELTVLWDAEPPLIRPSRFIKGLPSFFKKTKLIFEFMKEAKSKGLSIVSCEYASTGSFINWIYRRFGVSFERSDGIAQKMVMCYTSFPLVAFLRNRLLHQIKGQQEKYRGHYSVALGTIAKGAFGNEPILPPEGLRKDLAALRDLAVEEVALFRLGGLDEAYIKVLNEHFDA